MVPAAAAAAVSAGRGFAPRFCGRGARGRWATWMAGCVIRRRQSNLGSTCAGGQRGPALGVSPGDKACATQALHGAAAAPCAERAAVQRALRLSARRARRHALPACRQAGARLGGGAPGAQCTLAAPGVLRCAVRAGRQCNARWRWARQLGGRGVGGSLVGEHVGRPCVHTPAVSGGHAVAGRAGPGVWRRRVCMSTCIVCALAVGEPSPREGSGAHAELLAAGSGARQAGAGLRRACACCAGRRMKLKKRLARPAACGCDAPADEIRHLAGRARRLSERVIKGIAVHQQQACKGHRPLLF